MCATTVARARRASTRQPAGVLPAAPHSAWPQRSSSRSTAGSVLRLLPDPTRRWRNGHRRTGRIETRVLRWLQYLASPRSTRRVARRAPQRRRASLDPRAMPTLGGRAPGPTALDRSNDSPATPRPSAGEPRDRDIWRSRHGREHVGTVRARLLSPRGTPRTRRPAGSCWNAPSPPTAPITTPRPTSSAGLRCWTTCGRSPIAGLARPSP